MNLKQRFSFIFSVLFSVLLGLVLYTIFSLFSEFRREEFENRLAEKAQTTVRLLVDVKEIDYQLLKAIDRNTINTLYNEKVLIFDDQMKLIYSSIDDAVLRWTVEELQYLKVHKKLFRTNDEYDVYGIYYKYNGKTFFVLVTAEDKYGNSKIIYLKYLLIAAFFISSILVFVLSFYLSKKALLPLDIFSKQIRDITDRNLNTRIPVTDKTDEINTLKTSFNEMMNRIDLSYRRQKEFTGNASHELRTPIARIVTQLENISHEENLDKSVAASLQSVVEEVYYLSDVVTSLLLLSKISESTDEQRFEKVRLDEVVFDAASQLKKFHPDFKLSFEIENTGSSETNIEINGDVTLLQIAFVNLFKNAYAYSDDKHVRCTIRQLEKSITVHFVNHGPVPDVENTESLFTSFMRGSNTINKPGSGLGLSIVSRIVAYHHATIQYIRPDNRTNELILTFSKN